MNSMCKKLAVSLLLMASSACFAEKNFMDFEEEVMIYNDSCQFANQGMWAASYTADGISLKDHISDLKIKVRVHDREKKVVYEGTMEFENLSPSTGGRYASSSIVGEEVCQGDGFLEVVSAPALRDDKKFNIKIAPRDFKPTAIVVKN